jgi:hypothetical protein
MGGNPDVITRVLTEIRSGSSFSTYVAEIPEVTDLGARESAFALAGAEWRPRSRYLRWQSFPSPGRPECSEAEQQRKVLADIGHDVGRPGERTAFVAPCYHRRIVTGPVLA